MCVASVIVAPMDHKGPVLVCSNLNGQNHPSIHQANPPCVSQPASQLFWLPPLTYRLHAHAAASLPACLSLPAGCSGVRQPVLDYLGHMTAVNRHASTPTIDLNLTLCATGQQFSQRTEGATVNVSSSPACLPTCRHDTG